jgi:hypothetical protein
MEMQGCISVSLFSVSGVPSPITSQEKPWSPTRLAVICSRPCAFALSAADLINVLQWWTGGGRLVYLALFVVIW